MFQFCAQFSSWEADQQKQNPVPTELWPGAWNHLQSFIIINESVAYTGNREKSFVLLRLHMMVIVSWGRKVLKCSFASIWSQWGSSFTAYNPVCWKGSSVGLLQETLLKHRNKMCGWCLVRSGLKYTGKWGKLSGGLLREKKRETPDCQCVQNIEWMAFWSLIQCLYYWATTLQKNYLNYIQQIPWINVANIFFLPNLSLYFVSFISRKQENYSVIE